MLMLTVGLSTELAVSQSVPANAWQSAFVEHPGKQLSTLAPFRMQ